MAIAFNGTSPREFVRNDIRRLVGILNDEATKLQTDLVKVTPADRGQLRGRWTLKKATENKPVAIVGQSSVYFLPLEMGRKPGKGISAEGQENVAKWALRVGAAASPKDAQGLAYLLSRKYKLEGKAALGFAGLAKPGDKPTGSYNESIEPVGSVLLESFNRLKKRL